MVGSRRHAALRLEREIRRAVAADGGGRLSTLLAAAVARLRPRAATALRQDLAELAAAVNGRRRCGRLRPGPARAPGAPKLATGRGPQGPSGLPGHRPAGAEAHRHPAGRRRQFGHRSQRREPAGLVRHVLCRGLRFRRHVGSAHAAPRCLDPAPTAPGPDHPPAASAPRAAVLPRPSGAQRVGRRGGGALPLRIRQLRRGGAGVSRPVAGAVGAGQGHAHGRSRGGRGLSRRGARPPVRGRPRRGRRGVLGAVPLPQLPGGGQGQPPRGGREWRLA